MKLVVGLGNPGREYARTRHNIGSRVVGLLAEGEGLKISKKGFSSLWVKGLIEGVEVLLLLPQTFMNRSGEAVKEAQSFYRIKNRDLLVIHDDLDLSLGKMKRDFDAGAAGHRGVESIIEALGTKDFYRVRLGIGRPSKKEEVERFVLSPFEEEEREIVEAMVMWAVDNIKQWMRQETEVV